MMPEDKFLSAYVTESVGLLETVETDLLELERLGAGAPPELAGRVFGTAHSIKGGAGFFELHTVKELAHKLETVLEMVRSGALAPHPEVISLLIQGFDKMKLLFADIASFSDVDVGDEILALSGLASSYLPREKKEQVVVMARYPVPGSSLVLEAGELLVDSYRSAGNGIALLLFDLIHDVQRLGKLPGELLAQVEAHGVLLDCGIDIFGVGTLDQESVADRVPFYVLLSTSGSASQLANAFGIEPGQVWQLEAPSRRPVRPAAPRGTAVSSPLPQEREAVTRLVYELTGISLDPASERLESLLGGLIGTPGCATYTELVYKTRLDPEFKQAVIDHVTNLETRFFRDAGSFDTLRNTLLPALAAARRRQYSGQPRIPLRVWSAACSTGQEAYSIAMVLDEVLGDEPFQLEVVGSDISRTAVAQAAAGRYSAAEIGLGLTPERRDRYFVGEDGAFLTGERLRSMVSFRRLSLHEDFAAGGRWDIVFCGHVAEDFSEAARTSLFERFHAVLEPDGVLVLGPTETARGACPPFFPATAFSGVYYAKAP
jgi:chemotaxis protein methyltransferase CheR